MHTLIIGGSRGIGWETARLLTTRGEHVTVTGRKKPDQNVTGIEFTPLDLSVQDVATAIRKCVNSLAEPVDRLVYAAGYYQEGRVTDLSEEQIQDMIQVCGSGFIFAVRALLLNQGNLQECAVVTSSSQWTARELEPIYNFAKAGVGHFAAALSFDTRIGKVLVVGPSGTKTAFWDGIKKDVSGYLEPTWVAEQIVEQLDSSFKYKFAKLLRDPVSVEIAEERSK